MAYSWSLLGLGLRVCESSDLSMVALQDSTLSKSTSMACDTERLESCTVVALQSLSGQEKLAQLPRRFRQAFWGCWKQHSGFSSQKQSDITIGECSALGKTEHG